ncbi:AAA family ATPase [Methylophilus sp. Leaf408]|uniref:AAA family ATPase n=1 Tax=Methylophilus sp. Leaf408 TaxID=2876561 RepID=UPI001E379F1A|nr:AAA family ATPase [Methylophilus sp. Leaf408]
MLTEIQMNAVASFKSSTKLITDKKINLVYGLNGTGKSTFSGYFYEPEDAKYVGCSRVSAQTNPVMVYNQSFVKDTFYEADKLKGIFSLSKENKEAEEKIAVSTKILHQKNHLLEEKRKEKERVSKEFQSQKQTAIDNIWAIKTKFSGGDRVLEYCLNGLMGKKETLFEYIQKIEKPDHEPTKTIQVIKDEVETLQDKSATEQPILPILNFLGADIESDSIFGSAILGNTDSEVADLIEKLGNADWIKQGLTYLPEEVDESAECPFCQQKTITSKFSESLKEYFDVTYQQKIELLETLKSSYLTALNNLEEISVFNSHPATLNFRESLSIKYQKIIDTLRSNIEKIDLKIKAPKSPQTLTDTSSFLLDFNQQIILINLNIYAHNEQLKNRESTLNSLKNDFWNLMRWRYDQTLARLETDRQLINNKLASLGEEIATIDSSIANAKEQIALAQKETVNVDEAVTAINTNLIELGIDGFKILKHTDRLYRVVRADDPADAFHTLSEGERMMISFLYFCELCKGKANPEDTNIQKIVVIDDPISSLSHIFVFNVGQLIRTIFFKDSKFSQVFVLTHSLYFFYELTDPYHERRKANQKLFRITKSGDGSKIEEMKYEEIQNDYQAYWNVINDSTQPPALIANCMRNIIEYFFNFVRKRDLNNVFLSDELQDNKYQAFYRYVNRESHSLGQNIIDMKEFNYDVFKEGLRLVFEKTGYSEHFIEMSKI